MAEAKLTDQDNFTKVKKFADDLISDNEFSVAYNFAINLDKEVERSKKFKIEAPDQYKKYKEIIIKLLWIGLPVMTQSEVRKIFKDNFAKSFLIPGYDHWGKLKVVLLGIMSLDERDVFKKQIIQALVENQEKLTSSRLMITNEEKEPTVANWIIEYNRALGTAQINDVVRTQFLVNSINVKDLTKEEKEIIQKLFDLYERLKLSSQTLEGYEMDVPVNEMGVNGTIRQGVFEPTPPETKKDKIIQGIIDDMMGRTKPAEGYSVADLKELLPKYPAGSLERRAIEEEIKRMKK